MRRKCTALLTLLIFAASVFLPSAASLAEPAASTTAATATTTTTTAADPAASTTAATATTSTPAATTPATTTTTPATTYTAYDNTPNLKDATGIVEGMKELRVKTGSDAGALAYALNMSRALPARLARQASRNLLTRPTRIG